MASCKIRCRRSTKLAGFKTVQIHCKILLNSMWYEDLLACKKISKAVFLSEPVSSLLGQGKSASLVSTVEFVLFLFLKIFIDKQLLCSLY